MAERARTSWSASLPHTRLAAARESPAGGTCGDREGGNAPWGALACTRLGRLGHGRAPPAVPVGNEKAATRRGEHLHARDWGGWGTGEPRRRYIRRRGERGQVEEQVEQPEAIRGD